MWVNVVLLRKDGRRLSAAELRVNHPMVGRLKVARGHERWDLRRDDVTRSGLLYDPAAARALAELHRVELLKIVDRGMILAGVEEVFLRGPKDRRVYRQAWWCWPADQVANLPRELGPEPEDQAFGLVMA